ncbi:hypothetical protein [Leptospirillum ferriphilum]|uniref:Uncharacterized protein n=1 Tax=Leptospirillum ferriphilum YSK TaxID=1441628 RepID=A0A059Y355_9BACT|nr:hypothetical protein [Leptospirillum ferriphilum]AIA31952.1 hypothetical protein Y981_10985 [Leptospirillum ferriphilum YSK]
MNHKSMIRFFVCAIFFPILFAVPDRAYTMTSIPSSIPVRTLDLVRVLSTYFPRIEGKVTDYHQKEVTIDRGATSGIYPGLVLTVTRQGAPFRDPYTRLLLGYREIRLGEVEVSSVTPTGATGVFQPATKGAPSPVPGDIVRLSGAPLPVAIVPASNYTDVRVLAHLSRTLDRSSRFRSIDPFRVEISMNTLGIGNKRDPGSLVRLAHMLKAKALIVADTTLIGKKVELDLKAVNAETGTTLAMVSGLLEGARPFAEALDSTRAVGFVAPGLPPLSNPDSVVTVPFIPRFIALGDYRGNGKNLLALSDTHRVYVSDFRNKAVHVKFEETDRWVPQNRHIFISSGPLIAQQGKNPRYQIAVSNIVTGTPYSYVLDYDGKTFHRIWKHAKLYLRIVTLPGKGPTLLGQKRGVNKPFLGAIHEYYWDRDHFEKGSAVSWPPGISLFGTQPLQLDGKTVYLEIADDNHLEVFDGNGDLRFKSPVYLGGYFDHFVYGRPHALLPVRQRNVHLKGRILTVESSGKSGNHPIVIVYKNVPMAGANERFQGYQYGQVFFYRWTGVNWVTAGKLARVKGFISDIALTRNPRTLKPELLVSTEPLFNFMNIENLYVNEGKLSTYPLPSAVMRELAPSGSAPGLINRPSNGGSR